MKKKHDTIESLLAQGQNTQLTASEQDSMLTALREYADFHTPAEVSTPRMSVLSRWYVWSAAVSCMLLLSMGTGIASQTALPGQILYPIKVDVVEPLLGAVYFDEQTQLAYKTTLLNKRLVEMETLYTSDTLTPALTDLLEAEIEDAGLDIAEIVTRSDEEEIAATSSLTALAEIITILRTQEYIDIATADTLDESIISKTENQLSALYDSEIEDFVKESPNEVTTYIQVVLDEIAVQVTESDDVSTSSAATLETYLQTATEALERGDYNAALKSTSEAQQYVEVNENIEALIKAQMSEM